LDFPTYADQKKKKQKLQQEQLGRGKNNEWVEGNDTVLQRLRTGGTQLKDSLGK
jgi:hypothetical protein